MSSETAMTTPQQAAQMIASARGILLDWDGCIAIGNRPRPAALAFIRRHVQRIAIVSNNSTHLPSDIAEILSVAGIAFPATRVVLAGTEALAFAAASESRPTMILGCPRIKAHAREIGLNVVRDHAAVVVLMRDVKFSYAKLERAVNALAAGARLIVSNPDLTHPGARGTVVPETGALLAALRACVDLSQVKVDIIGKPSPILFVRACATLGVSPENAVMIGDNQETDIAGARAAGMASILVAPGSPLALDEIQSSLGVLDGRRSEVLQLAL